MISVVLLLQGTVQALRLLREERNKKRKVCEEQLRNQALREGRDPDEMMLRRKREGEESKKWVEFEKNRRRRHVEIVSRLIEEENMKKKSEKMAEKAHWQGRWSQDETHRTRDSEIENHTRPRFVSDKPGKSGGDKGVNPVISGTDEVDRSVDSSSDDDVADVAEFVSGEEEIGVGDSLARPEIDGLWSAVPTHTKVEEREMFGKDEEEGEGVRGEGGGRERSKLEEKMMKDVVSNLRQSIVRKQVAAGREFKVSRISLSFTHTHTQSNTHACTCIYLHTHRHTHTHSLSLYLSLKHTHTHTHTPGLSVH